MELERKLKIAITIITAVILIAVIIVLFPHNYGNGTRTAEFNIDKGETLKDVARELKKHNLVLNEALFIWYTRVMGRAGDIQAGKYVISDRISIKRLSEIITTGEGSENDINITIPEGMNIADIDKLFAEHGLIEQGELLSKDIIAFEGRFFPDTYRFHKNESSDAIVKRMLDNFNNKVGAIDEEGLIIASMLEKEVRSERDMRIVSGIIKRRLAINMPLQIDASVAYGACRRKIEKGVFCDVSNVNLVDNIKIDSAYNTYMRLGLPAGPISNPGLKAINAALNPMESDFLYYLSTDSGETIFSRSAKEHERARREYILN